MNPPRPTRSAPRRAALVLALLTCACGPAQAPERAAAPPAPPPQPSAPAEEDPVRAMLLRELAARPADGGLVYLIARQADRAGHVDEALTWLRRLLASAWDLALDDDDFPSSRGAPAYREIAAELRRREPRRPAGEVALRISTRGTLSEGMAFDPATRRVFLGGGYERILFAVAPGGAVTRFAEGAGEALLTPLGIRVDSPRGLLWVASTAAPFMRGYTPDQRGRSRLSAFDLATGALRWTAEIGDAEHPTMLNDVAVVSDGSVLVTDSESSAVRRARPEQPGFSVLVPPGVLESPNGIAAAPDSPRAWVADLRGISRIDVERGTATPLSPPGGASIGGIDGLYISGRCLVGIQNLFGRPRIWRVALDAAGDRVEGLDVLVSGDDRITSPTTGAIVGDELWFMANPQLNTQTDHIVKHGAPIPPERLEDIAILRARVGC